MAAGDQNAANFTDPPADHEAPATPNSSSDPFYSAPIAHSPTRPSRGSLAALVAAIQQVVPPPPPPPPMMGRPTRSAAPSPAPRRAQCTHITMNRLHGNNVCHMCGKLPDMGWLYACRQDWLIEQQQESVATAAESAISVPDDSDYFEVMARYACSLKMSPSVIKQIRDGSYDFDQVEKLIAQKEHLISTIKKMEGLSTESTPASLHSNIFQSNASIIASLGATASSSTSDPRQPSPSLSPTPTQQPSTNKEGVSVTKNKPSQVKPERCNYMVCHACRPFLHERLYANIGSVLHDVFPPVSRHEANSLHLLNADVVRSFGQLKDLPEAPSSPGRLEGSQSLDLTMMRTRESNFEGETPLEWTTSSNSSSFFDDDAVLDPYPCPGPGVCPVYSRHSGCAYDSRDFDDGQRALNHGFNMQNSPRHSSNASYQTPDRARARLRRIEGSITGTPGRTSSTASSISLPTPTTFPLTPATPTSLRFAGEANSKPGKAATVCGVLAPSMDFSQARLSVGSDMSGKDSHDSFGSEVEVDGGVALTEEAVETGLPDIRTAAA